MYFPTYPILSPGAAPQMDLHEVARLRAASEHARRALPGPLGELAARELRAYADLGYRGAPDALVPQLARQVLALPIRLLPSPVPAHPRSTRSRPTSSLPGVPPP